MKGPVEFEKVLFKSLKIFTGQARTLVRTIKVEFFTLMDMSTLF